MASRARPASTWRGGWRWPAGLPGRMPRAGGSRCLPWPARSAAAWPTGSPTWSWTATGLLAGLAVTPARLADRLHALVSAASAAQALDQAEALLIETVDLAEKRTGIDLAEFRQILSERREALDPPSL